MTCTFAEKRSLREDALTARTRTGIRVPPTIHSRSTASVGRVAGTIASSGRSRWITRRTVAGETPNSGASCRIVRFVR
ncbi:hypothetical protein GCM10023082_01160 [Streptomyces tremellae]|uniref:Uncharacterized protein n=1 Tax=Streptomyces tremellae TaxID=1124239 RepID=A0ABP7DLP7_9ACTN